MGVSVRLNKLREFMRLSISTKYWSTDNRVRAFCLLRVVVVGPESVCLDSPDNQKIGLLTAFLVSSLKWKKMEQ